MNFFQQFVALRGAMGRASKHAGKLVAAALFVAGGVGGAALYLSTPPTGPVGIRITSPADGVSVTTDTDGCANGFTTDVVARTNAADGALVRLTSNGLLVAHTTVDDGVATFADVRLGTYEKHVLVATVDGVRAVSSITVQCADSLTCRLLGPTWSFEHPSLNGREYGSVYDAGVDAEAGVDENDPIWTRSGGDRTSSEGSPYQFHIDGLTAANSIASTIEVYVDGSLVGSTPKGYGGTVFKVHGVPLPENDGEHTVEVKCIDPSGRFGFSSQSIFEVDTKVPQLTMLEPVEGLSATPVEGKIRVCASTTSGDAFGITEAAGDTRSNFCVGIGTSTPTCAPMIAQGAIRHWTDVDAGLPDGGSICDGATKCQCPGEDAGVICHDLTPTVNGACVELECPGGDSFDLRASLYDDARNATTKTIQGVRCQGLQGERTTWILTPHGGSKLEIASDLALRILANNGPNRDEDPDAGGAQFTVIACTSNPVGTSAGLLAGLAGRALTEVATTTVVAATDEPCPLGNVAIFTAATLPQSSVDAMGYLFEPTRLVAVIAGSTSPPTDVWIDTTIPTVEIESPVCGSTYEPDAAPTSITVRSNALPVRITVTNSNGVQRYLGFEREPGL